MSKLFFLFQEIYFETQFHLKFSGRASLGPKTQLVLKSVDPFSGRASLGPKSQLVRTVGPLSHLVRALGSLSQLGRTVGPHTWSFITLGPHTWSIITVGRLSQLGLSTLGPKTHLVHCTVRPEKRPTVILDQLCFRTKWAPPKFSLFGRWTQKNHFHLVFNRKKIDIQ